MMSYRVLLALVVGVFLTVGVEQDPLAQSAPENAEANAEAGAAVGARLVSNGWNLGCAPGGGAGELFCEASQTIAVAETQQILLVVFVTPWTQADASDPFVLRFQLPHGLNLPEGVQILIDDTPAQSPVIQTSTQAGVYARIGLGDQLLESLRKGTSMNVSFTAMNGNLLTVPVTLDGFSAIFAKLQ